MAIAAFIDRVGYVSAEQVRERFDLSRRMAWRRLQALREEGEIRTARPLDGPGVFFSASAPKSKVRDLDHTLAAGWVAIELELAGVEVVTERMMRRAEHAAGERGLWSIQLPTPVSSIERRTHRPDLAVALDGRLIAVEVELTRKSRQRLKALMGGWARQSRYDEARYLCGSQSLVDLVLRQSRASGAERVVRAAFWDRTRSASELVGQTVALASLR